ncbi:MAG: hypothetical protein JWQ76_2336 [Ramlibacter sp.]|nr:hypothetical protein [Ramlibacter sp.]
MESRLTLVSRSRAALAALALCGCSTGSVFCPADIPEPAVLTNVGGYASAAACEAVRATATCAVPTGPSAACRTYCTTGPSGNFCKATITAAYAVVGLACFPEDSTRTSWAYSCGQGATCTCV